MSVEAMCWVIEQSPTSGTEKVVLTGIAMHANRDGAGAWPGVGKLARYANVNERSVQYALNRLVAGGHLIVRHRAGGDERVDVRRRPNAYEIVGVNPAAVQRLAPQEIPGVQPDASRGATGRAQGVQPVAPKTSLNRQRTRTDRRAPVDKVASHAHNLAHTISADELTDIAADLYPKDDTARQQFIRAVQSEHIRART